MRHVTILAVGLLASTWLRLQAAQAPATTAELVHHVEIGDIETQLDAAQQLKHRNLLQLPTVQRALKAAVMRDVQFRWTPKGDNDAYFEPFGELIPIAQDACGLADPEFAHALLYSGMYFGNSPLAYTLADEGAALLPELTRMLHDRHDQNRENAIGITADMFTEQRRGKVRSPLSREQRSAVLAMMLSTVEAGGSGADKDIYFAVVAARALAEIRDPQTIPAMRQVADNANFPMAPSLRLPIYWAIAVIEFCRDSPPMDSAELSPFLERMRSPDWRVRARSLYALYSGASDPYYAFNTYRVLDHFPERQTDIHAALIGLMNRENAAIAGSQQLQNDPIYKIYFDKVVQATAELKDAAAGRALLGAIAYSYNAADDIGRIGLSNFPLSDVLAYAKSGNVKMKAGAYMALSAVLNYKNFPAPAPLRAFIEAHQLGPIFAEGLTNPDRNARAACLDGVATARYYKAAARVDRMRKQDPAPTVRHEAQTTWEILFPPPPKHRIHRRVPADIRGAKPAPRAEMRAGGLRLIYSIASGAAPRMAARIALVE